MREMPLRCVIRLWDTYLVPALHFLLFLACLVIGEIKLSFANAHVM